MKNKVLTLVSAMAVAALLSCTENSEPEQKNNAVNTTQPAQTKARLANGNLFDGSEGAPISIEQAKRWKKNWREKNPEGTYAHYSGGDLVRKLLDQPGAVGLRLYYALDDDGNRQIFYVAVDAQGNDLLPSEKAKTKGVEYMLLDASWGCPYTCPKLDEL
ncbi:MAG: hypothetical protein ACK48F_02010 [Chryseotalea sp.]|jgi:hypothetical protein